MAIATSACPLIGSPAAAADNVRISGLSDVAFGTITNFAADSILAQNICVYAKSPPANDYRVTATGSGAGGAFLLNSGSSTLPYEVQWSAAPDVSVGTDLEPNQPLAAQHSTSGASGTDDCSKGPAATASVLVIIRSAALSSASSGTYVGTLTLLVAPE